VAGGAIDATAFVASGRIAAGGVFDVGRVAAAACGAGSGHFDFWVGRWDVTAGGQRVGTNDITREPGGCAVFEDYRDAGGTQGRSVSFFDPGTAMWYQTYVDSRGGRLRLAGTLVSAGQLVMTSPPLGQSYERWSWIRQQDGSVRQVAERTGNGGASFQAPYWDGLYRRQP
jgi:hypothetical protein